MKTNKSGLSRRAILLILAVIVIIAVSALAASFYRFETTVSTTTFSSSTFASNTQGLVNWFVNNYNSTAQLIQGGLVGNCGYQPNAFDLIDGNFFGGHALQAHNASMGNAILNTMNRYLQQVGYQHNDRREVLFGNPIPFPPLQGNLVTIAGSPPPSDCSSQTKYWIVTEMPTQPWTNYTGAMNSIVPALLEKFREGDISTARSLFNVALSWWNGKGFMSNAARIDGNFHTRDLCYFLFAQRATRFSVDPNVLNQIQSELWSLQVQKFNGGLETGYNFDGTPFGSGGHTSNEINGLCLLAYDPRIQTQWWPASSSPSTSVAITGGISGVFILLVVKRKNGLSI